MLQGSPTDLVARFERQRRAFALERYPSLNKRLSRFA